MAKDLNFDALSRRNRAFFDSLIRFIYGDIRLPLDSPLRATFYDDWEETQLPWWVAPTRKELDMDCRTIAEVLSARQRKALYKWISEHHCANIEEGRGMLHEIFNDCHLVALNSVEENEKCRPTHNS